VLNSCTPLKVFLPTFWKSLVQHESRYGLPFALLPGLSMARVIHLFVEQPRSSTSTPLHSG
jgi:hypothetical protein